MRIQKPQDAAESVNSVLAGDNQPIADLALLQKATWVASSTIIHHPPSASVASVCPRGSLLTDIYMTRSVKLDKERIQSNQLCCWPPHLPRGHAQRWASITLLPGLPWTMPGKVCLWSFITTRKTQFISDMSEFLLGPECIPASTAISGQCFSDRHRILPTSSDHQSLQQLQYVGTHEATALFIPPPSKAVCFEKSLCEAGKVILERFFKALKMEAEGADGLGHQSHCHLLSCPEKEEGLPEIVLTIPEQDLWMGCCYCSVCTRLPSLRDTAEIFLCRKRPRGSQVSWQGPGSGSFTSWVSAAAGIRNAGLLCAFRNFREIVWHHSCFCSIWAQGTGIPSDLVRWLHP